MTALYPSYTLFYCSLQKMYYVSVVFESQFVQWLIDLFRNLELLSYSAVISVPYKYNWHKTTDIIVSIVNVNSENVLRDFHDTIRQKYRLCSLIIRGRTLMKIC